MKPAPTSSVKLALYLVSLVLVMVPFHGFLTVWGSSLVGHYVALRLWDDVLLAVIASMAGWWLVRDADLRRWFFDSLLVRLIGAYAGLLLLLGIVAIAKGDVTPKALAYGLLVDLRFLVWFLVVLLTVHRSSVPARQWYRLLLAPAAVVAVFAVLQYTVLPHDFLSHFGYNATTTIAPIETINHDPHYIRAQSTLRGANPLGAYLVVALAAAALLAVSARRRWAYAGLGLVALAALYASGSRSAWIGAAAAVLTVAWFWFDGGRARRMLAAGVLVLAALGGAAYLAFKDNPHLQNELLHTQTHSAVASTSNQAHASAVATGLRDVVRQPLGDGPGTAGPASAYNGQHPVRIAENYYVQIAQEAGWPGLVLFLAIVALVGAELYQRIRTSRLSLILFAALIGVSIVNLLSHAWTDDTLAFIWWGLAAAALADHSRPSKPKGAA